MNSGDFKGEASPLGDFSGDFDARGVFFAGELFFEMEVGVFKDLFTADANDFGFAVLTGVALGVFVALLGMLLRAGVFFALLAGVFEGDGAANRIRVN